MPRIKDTDYLRISAGIRARETRLLTKERRDRMIEAKTSAEALRVLSECGYPDIADGSYEAALASEMAQCLQELAASAPNSDLVDFFRIKYDYHNIKVMLKSDSLGIDAKRLLSESGRVSQKVIADCFQLNQFSSLPDDMAQAISVARDVLDSTGDPRLCDLSLDRACYAQMDKLASASGSSFLKGYMQILGDSANLRALARMRRFPKGDELLRSALVPGGSISPAQIREEAFAGKTHTEIFSGTPLAQAAAEADINALERECDNAAVKYLQGTRLTPFGDAVPIAYIAAKEAELTAVRIIMAGKKAGLSGEAIRERLRDSYV